MSTPNELGRFALHPGLPKTATTTLQNSLFLRHPQVLHLGKATPFDRLNKDARTSAVREALTPLLWDHRRRFDPAALRDAARACDPVGAADEHLLLASWEGLAMSERLPEMIRRARAAFADVRVLVVLRHPVAWAPSLYLQQLNGNFLRRIYPVFGRRPYLDFDAWLDVHVANHAGGPFSYAEHLARALRVLPRDRFGIFRFEDFVRDPVPFVEGICRFLGIDPAPAGALIAGVHRNERISAAQLTYLQRLDRHPLRRLRWALGGRRRAGAVWHRHADGPLARVDLSPERQRRILAISTPALQPLAIAFGLDLATYFEPLPGASASK